MYLKFRRANSAENFTWYREVCPPYCHKMWKWYDESLLRVKICDFSMNKYGASHCFHLHARAPPTAVPGCVDERMHDDVRALRHNPGLQYPPLHGPVYTPENSRWDTPATCITEGLACRLTLCILEQMICNFTNSVQIYLIQTLKLVAFSWTIRWC